MPKKSISNNRTELTPKLDWEIRQFSTATVIVATAIAQKVGMNASDLQCAEFLVRMGPLTAGQLAELSGLTTGAITGVIDRLEKAGWVKRENDPNDRRRVIIRPVPQDSPATEGLYDPYTEVMSELLKNYNDDELNFILDFVKRFSAATNQIASKIRSG